MDGNYQVIRFSQERVGAQLKVAESHRLARQVNEDSVFLAAAGRAYDWAGRVSGQLAHSLESLGETRIALFQR